MAKKIKKIKKGFKISTLWECDCIGHIIGLDLSLNGSAGTVLAPGTGKGRNVISHFLCSEKKGLCKTLAKKEEVMGVLHLQKPKGRMTEPVKVARLDSVLKFLVSHINSIKPTFVAIEDYAYGAKGDQFHIGELTGAVKTYLWRRGIPFRMYDPKTIKKYGTGSGNADKADMLVACLKKWKQDFMDYDKVKDNVADSFIIARLLELELDLRRGHYSLSDLTNKEREIFQRVTKTYPVNILERPFIMQGEES